MEKLTLGLEDLKEQIYNIEQHYKSKLEKDPIYIKLLEQKKTLECSRKIPDLISLLSENFPNFIWSYTNTSDYSRFTNIISGEHNINIVGVEIHCDTALTLMDVFIGFHLGVLGTIELDEYIVTVPDLIDTLQKILKFQFPILNNNDKY